MVITALFKMTITFYYYKKKITFILDSSWDVIMGTLSSFKLISHNFETIDK